ncbi:hypothetical protein [Shinella sp.]|uniref:hypothetical protein n=1 Tax=Shinella sp. TaxID=1870904 RepID=UPI00301D441B
MIGLVDAAKIAGGFALGALLVAPAAHYLGKREARQETAATAAVEAINRIQDLEKNNATFRSLPSRDRCLVLMRDSRLPDAGCD